MGRERWRPAQVLRRHLGNVGRALLLLISATLAILGTNPSASKGEHWGMGSYEGLIRERQVQINFTNCSDACSLATATLAEMLQTLGDRVGHAVSFGRSASAPNGTRRPASRNRLGLSERARVGRSSLSRTARMTDRSGSGLSALDTQHPDA